MDDGILRHGLEGRKETKAKSSIIRHINWTGSWERGKQKEKKKRRDGWRRREKNQATWKETHQQEEISSDRKTRGCRIFQGRLHCCSINHPTPPQNVQGSLICHYTLVGSVMGNRVRVIEGRALPHIHPSQWTCTALHLTVTWSWWHCLSPGPLPHLTVETGPRGGHTTHKVPTKGQTR